MLKLKIKSQKERFYWDWCLEKQSVNQYMEWNWFVVTWTCRASRWKRGCVCVWTWDERGKLEKADDLAVRERVDSWSRLAPLSPDPWIMGRVLSCHTWQVTNRNELICKCNSLTELANLMMFFPSLLLWYVENLLLIVRMWRWCFYWDSKFGQILSLGISYAKLINHSTLNRSTMAAVFGYCDCWMEYLKYSAVLPEMLWVQAQGPWRIILILTFSSFIRFWTFLCYSNPF